jgi:hypothetical protein
VSAEREDVADENTPDGTLLLTFHDEESAQYTLQTRSVQRVQHRGDELLHRETYRIPDAVIARWELKENGPARMVSLKLDPDPGDVSGLMGNQTHQINAAVGVLRPLPGQTEP